MLMFHSVIDIHAKGRSQTFSYDCHSITKLNTVEETFAQKPQARVDVSPVCRYLDIYLRLLTSLNISDEARTV